MDAFLNSEAIFLGAFLNSEANFLGAFLYLDLDMCQKNVITYKVSNICCVLRIILKNGKECRKSYVSDYF